MPSSEFISARLSARSRSFSARSRATSSSSTQTYLPEQSFEKFKHKMETAKISLMASETRAHNLNDS